MLCHGITHLLLKATLKLPEEAHLSPEEFSLWADEAGGTLSLPTTPPVALTPGEDVAAHLYLSSGSAISAMLSSFALASSIRRCLIWYI